MGEAVQFKPALDDPFDDREESDSIDRPPEWEKTGTYDRGQLERLIVRACLLTSGDWGVRFR